LQGLPKQTLQKEYVRLLAWFGKKQRAEGLVGLSINDQRIALAHITRKRDDVFLENCIRREVNDTATRRQQLSEVVAEAGLTGADCSCVLGSRDYNIYLVEAPQVEPDEVSAAVRWKIKDLLDMPVDDAVVDVFSVPDEAFQGRKKMVYAVAAARSAVEQLIEMVDRAGLSLATIDIPELVMRNISSQFVDDRNGLAFISLKESGSTMNISRGGQLYLTRRINTKVGPDALLEDDWEMIRDRLVLEIQRSLDYFESQMGQNPVNQVMIAPRKKDTESMMNSLGEALATPIGVLDYTYELASPETITAETKGSCMMAIGAALRVDAAGEER